MVLEENIKTILYKSLVERKTYNEIAKELNCGKDQVYKTVKKFKKDNDIDRKLWKLDWYVFIGKSEEIIKEYLQGNSTIKLAKKYGVSDRTMTTWLEDNNVTIRNTGKISKIDQTIFDVIDTEIKAYTIGLITADGNVSKKETKNTITICLTESDKYILENINNNLLDGKGNIIISNKKRGKKTATLQFNGKHLKERLADFGIVPNKSHLLSKLSDNIPENLYHHYIRGLFDGDGVCSYQTSHKKRTIRIGYCAYMKEFVESYRNFLVDKLGLSQNKFFNTRNCWQCSWSKKNDIENFYEYIYKDATIFLGRKKKKIFDYVNTEVN